MRKAVKRAVRLQAWQLGAGSDKEREMISLGKIRLNPDGSYELFSREATGESGEKAEKGDWFKVDSGGNPYPNGRAFFEARHKALGNDWYLQTSEPMPIWTADEPMDESVRYLLDTGALSLHPEDPERYFSAMLWGTLETAPRDAVVVFYAIERDADGRILSVTFNFVAAEEFEKTYEVIV